jgi:hypothetical protein
MRRQERPKDWFDYLMITLFVLFILFIVGAGIYKEYLTFRALIKLGQ